MTQKDILNQEDGSSIIIHLYQEGMFWKAYEYSAYRFVFGVNRFKPTKKYVKAVGQEVISIGFPVTSLGKFSELFDIVTSNEKQMTIVSKNIHFEVSFEDWKASVISNEAKLKTEDKHADDDFAKCIIDEIKHCESETATADCSRPERTIIETICIVSRIGGKHFKTVDLVGEITKREKR